jgi:hypothetical protein
MNFLEKKIVKLIEELCHLTGLNSAQDYDGISTYEDMILYLQAVKNLLPPKDLTETYYIHGKEFLQKKYHLLIVEFVPFLCQPIMGSIAISEPLADFIVNNKKKADREDQFILHEVIVITKEDYEKLKKENPPNGYFQINTDDFSQSYLEEIERGKEEYEVEELDELEEEVPKKEIRKRNRNKKKKARKK